MTTDLCSYAQQTRKTVQDQVFLNPENDYLSDTITDKRGRGKDKDYLYDKMKGSDSWVVRNLANVILVGGDPTIKADDKEMKEHLSEKYFKDYEGLIIDSIGIISRNIYSKEDSLSTNSRLENFLDRIHVVTKENVVRRNLLFKEGDTIDPALFSTNEYLLRELPYFSAAFIIVRKTTEGHAFVNVFTRDSWTIAGTGELGDFTQVSLFDQNFLGTGNKLTATYLHNTKRQKTGGQVNYLMRNLWGKFIDAEFQGGIGGTSSCIASIKRPYIYPGDYFWNAYAGYLQRGEGQKLIDSTCYIKSLRAYGTFGKSFNVMPKNGLSLYVLGGASAVRYLDAPHATAEMNPYYRDMYSIGGGIGVSRQQFFQGNMIYGYGKIEDIPYGFKAEFTGGWGYSPQSRQLAFAGFQVRYGFMANRIGFFDFTLQSSMNYRFENGNWETGNVDFWVKYFSPLFDFGGGSYLRNFVTIRHTHGINRLMGEREILCYTGEADVRGLRAPYERYGHNRTIINLESVYFSPVYFLHFRLAGFAWADMGWLGDEDIFWKNRFSMATGIGVRIKNERLIIDNVEIRLGFAIKKYPENGYSIFGISNDRRLKIQPFTPGSIREYDYD